jgi:hypothetical protein
VSDLPLILQEIEEVAGHTAALQIVRARGGERVMIPKTAREGHWLTNAVGIEAARGIVQRLGGETITLPADPTRGLKGAQRAAAEAIGRGLSSNEAARVSGLTRRAIEKRRQKIREVVSGGQGDLFRAANGDSLKQNSGGGRKGSA